MADIYQDLVRTSREEDHQIFSAMRRLYDHAEPLNDIDQSVLERLATRMVTDGKHPTRQLVDNLNWMLKARRLPRVRLVDDGYCDKRTGVLARNRRSKQFSEIFDDCAKTDAAEPVTEYDAFWGC